MAPECKGAEFWIIRILRVVFSLAVVRISFVVPVVFAEEFPEFTHQPESSFISGNDPVTLTCTASPSDVYIRWLYNGQPLDERRHHGLRVEGSNLVFQHDGNSGHVTKLTENAGVYRCTATNGLGTIISKPAYLSNPELEEFQPSSSQTSMRVPQGGYVTLTCDPPHSLPDARVIFVKDGRDPMDIYQENAFLLPSGNLVLSRLTSSASGTYRCVATNPVSGQNTTSPSAISLLVDPRLKDEGLSAHVLSKDRVRRVRVSVGQNVTLECPSYGHKWDSITWSKYGGSLPPGRWQNAGYGNLKIFQAQHSDNGTYKCSSANRRSSSSTSGPVEEAQVYLEVQEAPSVRASSRTTTLEEGQRVELRCQVQQVYPMPNLTWFHNGREVAHFSTGKGEDGAFDLAHATHADSGIYQCMAANELGTVSDMVKITVIERNVRSPEEGLEAELPPLEEEDFDDSDLDGQEKGHRRDRKKFGRRKKMRMRERRKKKKGEKEKPKYAPSVPTVTQLSERTVMLNWTVPDRDNGQTIKFFKVQFKEMSPKKGSWQTSDAHLAPDARRFEVVDLKRGGSYKFRIFAVYEDDDNKNSDNTPLFQLGLPEQPQARVPDTKPIIVEAQSVIYQNKYGIGIKWQYKAETASPIEGFVLLYKPYGIEDDQELVLPGANIRNHVITDLKPETYYSIRIQSFNMVGRSGYSNQVVETTKSRPESSNVADDFPPKMNEPSPSNPTDAPTSGRHSNSNSLEQPVILGIVLGALLLALAVLVSMCYWKQHQQKRRNLASESQKFQDQSHCIYSDALPPQHSKPNGGLYPHMGNGHGPPHESSQGNRGGNGMNIGVNPLAEYDLQTAVHPTVHPDNRGKQYYGNGVDGENVGRYRDSGEMMYVEDAVHQQQQQQQQQQLKPGHSIQHRTLPSTPNSPLSSFYNSAGSQTNEYSEPIEREFPKSPSGLSHPLQGVPMNSQGLRHPQGLSHSSSASYKHGHPPPLHHQSLGHPPQPRGYGYDWSGSYEHAHGGENPAMGRHTPLNFRGGQEYPNNPVLMYQQSQQPARYPVHPPAPLHSSGEGSGVRSPIPPLYYKTVPVDYGQKQPSLQQANGRHKKRKKRQQVREPPPYYKETGVRDQATNTDLSSNGTIEFTSFGKSGSSSNSVSNCGSDTGCIGGASGMADDHNRDSSFANNGSLESVDNESVSAASVTSSHDYDLHASADYSLPL